MSYTEVLDPLTRAASKVLVHRDADGAAIPADPDNRDWQAYQDWLVAGNAPTPCHLPSTDWAGEARSLLQASDVTVLRCVEAGVAVPAELTAYRRALRDVVDGRSNALPERPAYPVGS